MTKAAQIELVQGDSPSTPAGGRVRLFVNTSGVLTKKDSTGTETPVGGSASGDMAASMYDPQNIQGDAFSRSNHTGDMPASNVTQDSTHRFISDSERAGWDNKEPGFAKNSAFNKDFGGTGSASTVSRSDHDHDTAYEALISPPTSADQIRVYQTDGSVSYVDRPATETEESIHVQDQKTAGTDGGTFTSGARRTRDLNTVVHNSVTGATLSGNRITLPPGQYSVYATAPCCGVGGVQMWLHNVTTAQDLAHSASYYAVTNHVQTLECVINCDFYLAGTSQIEIQQQCTNSYATYGFGKAAGFDTEIYSTIHLHKH